MKTTNHLSSFKKKRIFNVWSLTLSTVVFLTATRPAHAIFRCCYTDTPPPPISYNTACNPPYCDEPCKFVTARQQKHCGYCVYYNSSCDEKYVTASAVVIDGRCDLAGVDGCACEQVANARPYLNTGLWDLSC